MVKRRVRLVNRNIFSKNVEIFSFHYQNFFFIFNLVRSFLFIITEVNVQCYLSRHQKCIDYFIKINVEFLIDCFLLLKNSLLFSYNQLINLTCIDNLNLEPFSRKGRFSLVYVLNNINEASRLIVSTDFSEKRLIPSITEIYKNGNWFEREVFDMFGIFFKDHLDLRRLLTDYGFKGFPLRKDFPLTGYIELRYSEEKRYVKYKKLILIQEYRFFDFESPWRQYEGSSFVYKNNLGSFSFPGLSKIKFSKSATTK